MFILEGIPAIIIGIVVVFYLTNRPTNAKWLSKEESDWLEGELNAERKVSSNINKVTKLDMLKDSKIWKLALLFRWVHIYLWIVILDANHHKIFIGKCDNQSRNWLVSDDSIVSRYTCHYVCRLEFRSDQ